jgi:hypothetical protein
MAALLLDRVIETTTTTGTGTINLAGAQTGYNAFRDEATDGGTVFYLILDDPASPTSWEYGLGTLTYGTPDTLSRDTVLDSSNSGSKISLAAATTYTVLSPFGKNAAQPSSEAKTTAYTLTMTDIGKFFSCDASSAGFTVTLPAAATATGRYWAIVANTGASNNVTLDADGSETINGATTLVLPPNSSALLRCDGSEWAAVTSDDVEIQFASASSATPASDDKFLFSDTDDGGAVKTAALSGLAALGLQLKTGGYSGDGTTSNAITGVGFEPKFLFIWESQADGGNPQWGFTSDSYMANDAQGLMVVFSNAGNSFSQDNRVLSLDSDGFTLSDDGANSFPNTSGTAYQYIALG